MNCRIFLLLPVISSQLLTAEDWPRWRSSSADGISAEIIGDFSDQEPAILWKGSVGIGFAGLSVAEGRLFTTGNSDAQDTITCLDAVSGEKIWSHSYTEPLAPKYYEGGTSATPTVHEGVVYQLSRQGKLFALDAANGELRWQRNVGEAEGMPLAGWGFGGSPVVHGKLLLLNVGEAGMAVDLASGEIVWKSAAEEAGYSTPTLYQAGERTLAVFSSGKHYIAAHPETGEEVWRHKWSTRYGVNASDPIISGDFAFISSDYGKGCTLITLSGDSPEEVYENKEMQTQMNPCVLHEGYLYGVSGGESKETFLKCVKFQTGETMWSVESAKSGSVMMASGKLIHLSGRGELTIGSASPKGFAPTLVMQVLGGKSWTSPTLANGLLYCRNSMGDIVCIDARKP